MFTTFDILSPSDLAGEANPPPVLLPQSRGRREGGNYALRRYLIPRGRAALPAEARSPAS